MLPNPHEPPVTKKYNFLSQSNVKGTVKNYTSLNFAYNANGMGLPSLPAPCRLPYHVAVAGCQPSPTAACEHSIMHVASAIAKKLPFSKPAKQRTQKLIPCARIRRIYMFIYSNWFFLATILSQGFTISPSSPCYYQDSY